MSESPSPPTAADPPGRARARRLAVIIALAVALIMCATIAGLAAG